jgi:hypothetical protein
MLSRATPVGIPGAPFEHGVAARCVQCGAWHSFFRDREVWLQTNARYFDGLAVVDDPTPGKQAPLCSRA